LLILFCFGQENSAADGFVALGERKGDSHFFAEKQIAPVSAKLFFVRLDALACLFDVGFHNRFVFNFFEIGRKGLEN